MSKLVAQHAQALIDTSKTSFQSAQAVAAEAADAAASLSATKLATAIAEHSSQMEVLVADQLVKMDSLIAEHDDAIAAFKSEISKMTAARATSKVCY